MFKILLMKKILCLIFILSAANISLLAQSVYELSFTFAGINNSIDYKAFFIDYNDGKGKLRLRFISPASGDSVLADIDVVEENAGNISNCLTNERIYYKLQTAKYIESKDPGINIPQYLCFQKENNSGLYEPLGMANAATDCKADVVKFSNIAFLEQKNLTMQFVLTYFKMYEPFYRNLFATNNPKALTTSERNVKLFLLFVANVTDDKIGTADRKNMNDAITFFGKIKEFLGIDIFIYDTITGQNFNKKFVINKLNTFLTPGPNDIVVFYYSGHGFRQPRDGRPGPYIDLRDLRIDLKKKYLENSLSMEDIAGIIKAKGARLNLVLSDCCNDNVTSTNPMVLEQPLAGKKGGLGMNWSTQNCRDLFLSATPTTIFATAASPYQLAISNPFFGGYFSNFFRNAVETNLSFSKTKVNWEDVFAQTKQQTETKAGRTWCDEAKTVKCNRQLPYINIMYGRF